jgi:hypothetical protein
VIASKKAQRIAKRAITDLALDGLNPPRTSNVGLTSTTIPWSGSNSIDYVLLDRIPKKYQICKKTVVYVGVREGKLVASVHCYYQNLWRQMPGWIMSFTKNDSDVKNEEWLAILIQCGIDYYSLTIKKWEILINESGKDIRAIERMMNNIGGSSTEGARSG